MNRVIPDPESEGQRIVVTGAACPTPFGVLVDGMEIAFAPQAQPVELTSPDGVTWRVSTGPRSPAVRIQLDEPFVPVTFTRAEVEDAHRMGGVPDYRAALAAAIRATTSRNDS